MNKIKIRAKFAGLSYLLIIVAGIFSHLVARASIVVKNDAMTTAQNIVENDMVFRLSILSDFVMILSYLMLGVLFYSMFKDVNNIVAKVLVALNVIGASIMGLNMLNQQAALLILDGSHYLSVFDTVSYKRCRYST